jgi:hypothetical protein
LPIKTGLGYIESTIKDHRLPHTHSLHHSTYAHRKRKPRTNGNNRRRPPTNGLRSSGSPAKTKRPKRLTGLRRPRKRPCSPNALHQRKSYRLNNSARPRNPPQRRSRLLNPHRRSAKTSSQSPRQRRKRRREQTRRRRRRPTRRRKRRAKKNSVYFTFFSNVHRRFGVNSGLCSLLVFVGTMCARAWTAFNGYGRRLSTFMS